VATESPVAAIERLLREGRALDALAVAEPLATKNPRMLQAWLGVARAKLHLGWIAEADEALERLDAFAAADPQVALLRGIVHQRLGRIDQAADRLRAVATGRSLQAVEASVALGELHWFAHQHDALKSWLASAGPAWAHDPRAALLQARLLGRSDPAAAVDALRALCNPVNAPAVRRAAGFEAVGLLDRQGRYREAYDLALAMHADTTAPFDLDGLLLETGRVAQAVARGDRFPPSRVEPVEGICLVAGLPRSGTTLLEQMLDRHPSISGIGEYEGLARIYSGLKSQPAWPRRPGDVPVQAYAEAQRVYREGADRLRRPGAKWAFDKTIRAWRSIPEIAVALPGTRCIHVRRGARDTATSLFLSYFQTDQIGWTHSFDSIRRVIELERRLVPRVMEVLGVEHVSVRYEDLVDDTAAVAGRCLGLLGLAMDERVLRPEQNTRAAVTISAMQVRKPINRSSIGRWKNYEFAFDGSWDALD